MTQGLDNVYADVERARAYADLGFPGTYFLAFRDIAPLLERQATGRRALDFGCGTGRSTRFLRGLGFAVTGVDISGAMIDQARRLDPQGNYRQVTDGNLASLPPGGFDLAFAAFTFDNIGHDPHKAAALRELRRLLAPHGRLVVIVSAPEIYRHEWASFSTRDFPGNREARDGDEVRIVMLDVADRRPVLDVLCSDERYRRLFAAARLDVLETLHPLATGSEPIAWVSETTVAPWTIYLLGPSAIPE